jgi:predicted transcriptional regulator
MRHKKPPELTPAELRLMNIIWKTGRATVAEVAAALPEDPPLAYNTVLTTMRILEDKGYLRHAKAKDGRAFVYIAKVGHVEAKRNAVRHLLGRFFGDSPESLVLNLLEDETLGRAELRKIRQLLQERKGEAE